MGWRCKMRKTALERAQLWGDVDVVAAIDDDDNSMVELADLVASYYNNIFDEGENVENYGLEMRRGEKEWGDWKDELEAELAELRSDSVADWIRVEAELAVGVVGLDGDVIRVRRRVVKWLRERGFDAGLCKSTWDKDKGVQAGSHEYIDILVKSGSQRYILDLNLPSQFEIARPSSTYIELLTTLPPLFVGKPESLQRIINIMCTAAKASIRIAGMHIPPWRRKEYVLLKWFSSYKRVTNGEPQKIGR